jgi:hypothetical protein
MILVLVGTVLVLRVKERVARSAGAPRDST